MKKTLIIHPEELSKYWIDKISSLGCSAIGIHPAGGAVASETLERMISCFDDKEFTQLLDYACEKGLEIEYEMHAARYLLPEKYYKNNPEYFRMNKSGERVADYNFCVSNEDALKIVEENALDLAKKLYRSSKKFYFWMDDAKDSFCHCEKCKELSPSDQQLKVLNRIIKKLKSEHYIESKTRLLDEDFYTSYDVTYKPGETKNCVLVFECSSDISLDGMTLTVLRNVEGNEDSVLVKVK